MFNVTCHGHRLIALLLISESENGNVEKISPKVCLLYIQLKLCQQNLLMSIDK